MSLLVQDYILMWLLFLYFDNLLLFKVLNWTFFLCLWWRWRWNRVLGAARVKFVC